MDRSDAIWKALSDPTRRDVLDLLRRAPRTTGDLCGRFPRVSRIAVVKHINVLRKAGLITIRTAGRERWNHLNAVPLQSMYERWVRPYEAHWARRALDLKDHVEHRRLR